MGFITSFLSYLLLVLVFVVVAGVAVSLGIYLRRRKDANTPEAIIAENK